MSLGFVPVLSSVTPTDVADAVWAHQGATDMAGRLALALAILRNKTVTDPGTGTMTVYADDGVTPLLTAQLFEDASGAVPYRGSGAERRERLA